LTTGAFRFVTGHSDKTAYKITTPLAAIGVRGTTIDILSQRFRTTVVLQDGMSRACAFGGQCIDLTQPGDTAIKNRIRNLDPWLHITMASPQSGAARSARTFVPS
jgi:hypothetical protein